MSHNYIPYAQRIAEIDISQDKVKNILAYDNSNFLQTAIQNQFESSDELRIALNYYIRKIIDLQGKENASKAEQYINLDMLLEDLLLVMFGYCKFLSAGTMQEIFKRNDNVKQYIDGLNRLVKKGYICKTSQRDANGKSYYVMTEDGWSKYKQIIDNNTALLPSSDFNYNTSGLLYHDASVGKVFIRLLLLKMPFKYTRYYYTKGTRKRDDIYPDAIVRVLPSSPNERAFYIEGDTGNEGVEVIIDKIGKYYFKRFCIIEKNNYATFVYDENDTNFYRDNFPCLFSSDLTQLKSVIKLLSYYKCSLDKLISFLDDNNIFSVFNREEVINLIFSDKPNCFEDYKVNRLLLCIKSVKLLLSYPWLKNYIPEINNTDSDMQKVHLLSDYFDKHKYSNRIQYYIDCLKNINDTKKRKISLTKGIIKRYRKINDIEYMMDALNSIFDGVETLFLPVCICESYIQYCLAKESEHIYKEIVKQKLESEYKHPLTYSLLGAPFKTNNEHISDLHLRNCYYYYNEMNQPIEIYVENISLSLSAMVRVATLVNELMGVSLKNRNCTVICLVDSEKEIELFNAMLLNINQKYNNSTSFKIPVLYLLYDGISEGKLLDCKSYKLYDE